MSLKLSLRGRSWHLSIAQALHAATPFTFAISPDDRADARLREARDMLGASADRRFARLGRRDLTEAIIAMQSLQALDGHLAGASERDIAIAIFGARSVEDRWHSDSELRAKVRYLIKRGRIYMNGKYRHLLWGNAARRAGDPSVLPTLAKGRKVRANISPSRHG